MSIVRLVVAWLLMAALPLQGLAAGSMLFCDQAAHSTTAARAQHGSAFHDHADGFQVSHDHASDSHDGDSRGAADSAAKPSQQQSAASPDSATHDGHACPICASCCNLVALSETPTLSIVGDLPMAPPVQGPARVITRAAPAPDKPPRA